MSDLLSDERLTEALSGLNGWERDGDAIARAAELESFPAAIEAVRRVAEIAEARDHHPDIDIRWRTVTFRCWSHYAGGVTEHDVALAREINGVLPG